MLQGFDRPVILQRAEPINRHALFSIESTFISIYLPPESGGALRKKRQNGFATPYGGFY